jgi:hypothetical protein
MTASFRAELVRLLRPRVLWVTAIVTVLFAVGGALIVLATVGPTAGAGRGVTIAELERAGGGTQVFRTAASFAGTFLFVVFVAVIAIEFGRGTIRTMLLRQPRRMALLAGKLGAVVAFAAVVLAAGEVIAWVTARIDAPHVDVSTARWVGLGGLGAAMSDYGAVLVWVVGYLVLAAAVAVLARSVALALGVGFAWAGPIEHIVHNAWPGAARVFPGLSLEAFVARGTPDVSADRALALVIVYGVVALATAAVSFARWDATS